MAAWCLALTPDLTIQQVIERMDLSTRTPCYERVDLVSVACRGANGYRCRSDENLERIEFVLRLRATILGVTTFRLLMRGNRIGSPLAGFARKGA